LDKATDKREEVSSTPRVSPLPMRFDSKRIDEFKKNYDIIESAYKGRIATIEKIQKSFWARNKGLSELAIALNYTGLSQDLNTLGFSYSIDWLEKRLSNIEVIVQGITEKLDVDLSNIKKQIETLQNTLAQPEIAEVSKFIRDFSVKANEAKKKQKEAQDRYVT